jgi:N-acyl-D-amino-acid deacylase
MLLDDSADSMLRNGVTTNVCGNCGEGVVPIGGPYREAMVKYMRSSVIPGLYPDNFEYPWSTMAEYHDYIQCHPPMINMASLIPHGPVRMSLMGMEKGAADAEQTRQMKALVREGMEAGAFGLSTGLAYSPGDLVGVEELTNVSRPLQPYGGVYATHLRNQGEGIYNSLNEAAAIGRGAGIPIHISHLKQ